MEEICRTCIVLLGLPELQPRVLMTRDGVLIRDDQAKVNPAPHQVRGYLTGFEHNLARLFGAGQLVKLFPGLLDAYKLTRNNKIPLTEEVKAVRRLYDMRTLIFSSNLSRSLYIGAQISE